MPKSETIEQFISAVESNKHDKAIEQFYSPNASMQENQSDPRVGRDNLVAYEQKTLAKVKSMTSECIRPFFVMDDYVVIRWKFRFEWKNNTISEIEEITYQYWIEELIDKEQFFYDPKQFEPKTK